VKRLPWNCTDRIEVVGRPLIFAEYKMEHNEIVEAVKAVKEMTEARVIKALDAADQLCADFNAFDQNQSNDAAEGIAENFLKLQQLFQNPRDNRTGQDYYYQQTDGTEYVAGFWFVTKEKLVEMNY